MARIGSRHFWVGLALAWQVIEQQAILYPDVEPLLIILTDGAGNVSVSNLPPLEESRLLAEKFAQAQIRSVVINMERQAFDQGLAQKLADQLQGVCLTLSQLKADSLYQTVRQELQELRK